MKIIVQIILFFSFGLSHSYAVGGPEDDGAGVQGKQRREAWSASSGGAERREISTKQRVVNQIIEEFQVQLAKRRVLVLDGGGVRGALTAQLLARLEGKLQASTGKRISEFFQGSITGTSTGSFIALALVSPDKKGQKGAGPYTAEEIVNFYKEKSHRLFSGCCAPANCVGSCQAACTSPRTWGHVVKSLFSCFGCCGGCYGCFGMCGPRYSRVALDEEIEDLLGTDVPLKEALSNVQLTTYDIGPGGTFLYLSSTDPKTNQHTFDEGAGASSAAPTFYPAASIGGRQGAPQRLCVDGGLFDNSPTLAAISQAQLSLGGTVDIKDLTVLSVGTGQAPGAFNDASLRFAGALSWVGPAIEIGMDGNRDAAAASFKTILGKNYFRVKVPLKDTWLRMDDYRNVEALTKTASDEADSVLEKFFERIEEENRFISSFRNLFYKTDSVVGVYDISAIFRKLVGSTHEETAKRVRTFILGAHEREEERAIAEELASHLGNVHLLTVLQAAIVSVREKARENLVQPL